MSKETNIAKVTLLSIALFGLVLFATGCGAKNEALSLEEEAAKYGLTVEQLKEEKQAAARMNMSWDEHVKMIGQDNSEMDGMDMKNHK